MSKEVMADAAAGRGFKATIALAVLYTSTPLHRSRASDKHIVHPYTASPEGYSIDALRIIASRMLG